MFFNSFYYTLNQLLDQLKTVETPKEKSDVFVLEVDNYFIQFFLSRYETPRVLLVLYLPK